MKYNSAPVRSLRKSIRPLIWCTKPRQALILASWLYSFALHYAHLVYLNPVWDYYGFTIKSIDPIDAVTIFGLVTTGAIVMPTMIGRPSSIVLLLLYTIVYIPTIVFSLSIDVNGLERYLLSLLMLALGFGLACHTTNRHFDRTRTPANAPDNKFCLTIFAVWGIFALILISTYSSIMTFSGIDDIYEQRAAGASENIWMGYIQTYFGNVLSPALIAMGLVNAKLYQGVAGVAGCMIIYMINAQRTIFLLPIAVVGLYLLIKARSPIFQSTAFALLALIPIIVVSSSLYETDLVAGFISLFIVFRTLSLPGLTFSQYYDLFNTEGFTWWSHIKGFDLLISPPAVFSKHASWPNLGYIIGDRIYGNIENNVNANLFSGDGAAAAGAIGVFAIGLVLTTWLILFDKAARGWHPTFAALVALPIGLALTNGHFFTTMLSFGGIFWLITFHFYKPTPPLPNIRRRKRENRSSRGPK